MQPPIQMAFPHGHTWVFQIERYAANTLVVNYILTNHPRPWRHPDDLVHDHIYQFETDTPPEQLVQDVLLAFKEVYTRTFAMVTRAEAREHTVLVCRQMGMSLEEFVRRDGLGEFDVESPYSSQANMVRSALDDERRNDEYLKTMQAESAQVIRLDEMITRDGTFKDIGLPSDETVAADRMARALCPDSV